ncbi:MAG: hypothetical protein J7J38_00670 [Candidatus Aenigmarchaeota archaeon]|nr:hypothetical protein [Candidatus Aenigmarchaeota archaeon]
MRFMPEKNRCPICWAFGKKTGEKNMFICPRCSTLFNKFGILSLADIEEFEDLRWCLT